MDMNDDELFAPMANHTIEVNVSELMVGNPSAELPFVLYANRFYAYFTPVIIVVGIVGNILSLNVLLSKKLRNMSASRYLIALAFADIAALVFYVLSDWLRRGLKHLNSANQVQFFDTEGVCQLWLYFNYVSRFISAWLVVCFTIERFIGVCMPFRRRLLGLKETMRIIFSVIVCAFVLLSYKPVMSEVRTIRQRSACTSKKDYIYESYVLDTLYGLSITLVPFVIITVLNCLIIHKLVIRTRRLKHIIQTEESNIRLEFTFILLVISFFFIVFDLPYFVTWCWHFLHNASISEYNRQPGSTDYTRWLGILEITRTIFYLNYCINFFLYTTTGGYFRKELKALFRLDKMRASYESFVLQKVVTNPTRETHSHV